MGRWQEAKNPYALKVDGDRREMPSQKQRIVFQPSIFRGRTVCFREGNTNPTEIGSCFRESGIIDNRFFGYVTMVWEWWFVLITFEKDTCSFCGFLWLRTIHCVVSADMWNFGSLKLGENHPFGWLFLTMLVVWRDHASIVVALWSFCWIGALGWSRCDHDDMTF